MFIIIYCSLLFTVHYYLLFIIIYCSLLFTVYYYLLFIIIYCSTYLVISSFSAHSMPFSVYINSLLIWPIHTFCMSILVSFHYFCYSRCSSWSWWWEYLGVTLQILARNCQARKGKYRCLVVRKGDLFLSFILKRITETTLLPLWFWNLTVHILLIASVCM